MVGGGALASNKMQRTYVRVFFDRGKGEAFPSTCVGPSFGFRATQMRFRKSNEKYIFHPIRLGVTGITFTDSIAAVLRRYHVRRLNLYYKAMKVETSVFMQRVNQHKMLINSCQNGGVVRTAAGLSRNQTEAAINSKSG